jgi:hypothetical protein
MLLAQPVLLAPPLAALPVSCRALPLASHSLAPLRRARVRESGEWAAQTSRRSRSPAADKTLKSVNNPGN